MKQYEFHDLDVNTRGDPSWLPPEAMFIISDGIGIPLEDLIDGYQTLTVSGRELSVYEVNTQSVDNEDGVMFLSANRPVREIEVSYKLEAEKDEEFRAKYQLLNYYLSNKQFDFYFYDDDQYQWTGTVSSTEKPEPGKNIVKSSFTITCNDPYKRLRKSVIYTNRDGMLRITEPALYLTTPDLISIYLEDSSSTVQVSNGRQTISLTGVFNPNDNIKIRISTDADKQSDIILNGESHLELLNLDSDFENFALKRDDIVTVSPHADLSIKFRRKEL